MSWLYEHHGLRTEPSGAIATAAVLERHVDVQGRIDFRGLRDDDEALGQFVTWLADHGPLQTPEQFPRREDVLAYHINAYNALAMRGVLERGLLRFRLKELL